MVEDVLEGCHRFSFCERHLDAHDHRLAGDGEQGVVRVGVGHEVEEDVGRMVLVLLLRGRGLRRSGALTESTKDVGLVQIKAIKQVPLIRVVRDPRLLTDGFETTAEVLEALESLIDDHFLPQQVEGQQIHRQIGLFHQPT